MAIAKHITRIERPVEEVFAFMISFSNNPLWEAGNTLIETHKITPGPVGVGTIVRDVRNVQGKRIEMDSELVEYETNSRFTFRSMNKPPSQVAVTFEAIPEGTLITTVIEVKTAIFLLDLFMVPMMKRQLAATYSNLKKLLEGAMRA